MAEKECYTKMNLDLNPMVNDNKNCTVDYFIPGPNKEAVQGKY